MPQELDSLRMEASELLLEWARRAAPHYGSAGSMDLDLVDLPDADGPSYYNQFAHFSLLLLSEGVVPGATPTERESFRDLAIANLRYILSITDEGFHTPHYSRGRDWGRHVGEWLNYYALSSLQLMEEHGLGDAELRQALSEAIEGATAHIVESMRARFEPATPRISTSESPIANSAAGGAAGSKLSQSGPRRQEAGNEGSRVTFPGNHATWHGLLVYRAGCHFERPEWVEFAEQFFATWILPTQRPDGVWPEGEGIVVDYSMVTAQAVSLYAEFSDHPGARASMARALGFFLAFQLPDGSSAVVADGRMRYRPRPMLFFPPGFLRDPAGRRLCLDRVRGGLRDLVATGIEDNGAQGLAFYGAFVQTLMDWQDVSTATLVEVPQELPSARLDGGPWTALLGWQLTPEVANRFILDSQNFIEVYHADSGYLIGGGNSKYMPRFSTLRRTGAGRAYIPEAARCVRRRSTEIVALYEFGADQVEVALNLDGDDLNIRFRLLTSATNLEAGLMLPLVAGEEIGAGDQSFTVSPTSLINHTFSERAPRLSLRGRVFEAPVGARLEYPLVPHNPYTQTGLPAAGAYVARLSLALTQDDLEITIR